MCPPGSPTGRVILDLPETRLLGCSYFPLCAGNPISWTSPYLFDTGTEVALHIELMQGDVWTPYYPTSVALVGFRTVAFRFAQIQNPYYIRLEWTPVTPTCTPLPTVDMTSPKDGDIFFTCPDEGDFVLQELEEHTPTSGSCVPSIQWKEILMDVGTGDWHGPQDIHTAPLMPENHPTDNRTLVVQVKAENPEHFAAIDQARITLYKAKDRDRTEYIDSIHAAALFYGGEDAETFERYLTAILCHESYDIYERKGLNQYAWRGATDPNEYCNPIKLENKEGGVVVSTDWGIGQNNDKAFPDKEPIYDPVTRQPLWNSVERREVKYNPFYSITLAAALLKRAIRYQEHHQSKFGGITEEEKWWNASVLYHSWSKAIFYANEEEWEKIPEGRQSELIIYLWSVLLWLDKPCY